MVYSLRGGPFFIEKTEKEGAEYYKLDKNVTYFPLFCLVEVPDQYLHYLNTLAEAQDFRWILITSDEEDKEQLIGALESRLQDPDSTPRLTPFIDKSIGDAALFFRQKLCRAPDSRKRGQFTDYTSLVIDRENVHKDCDFSAAQDEAGLTPTITVVSDAPDFESEGGFHRFSVDLTERSLMDVQHVDGLIVTPKELCRPRPPPGKEWLQLKPIPHALLIPIKPFTTRNQQYRFGTRREVAQRKLKCIKDAESRGWDLMKTKDEILKIMGEANKYKVNASSS